MPHASVRSNPHVRPDRPRAVRRRLGLALALAVVAATMAAAFAQVPVDGECPPGAWCHPNGSGLSYIEDAASDVGGELVRRRESGDCTGLGPEGCLGVVLNQLMCAIDGRDWVQEYACAGGPVEETPPANGGGGAAGGGGATPPADAPAPPAGEEPEPEPETEALVVVVDRTVARWLRGELDKTNAGERVARVRLGDRATLDLIVWGRYERRSGDASAYFAVLRAIDSVDRRERFLVVGALGDMVYAGDVEGLRSRSRGGAAPTPLADALAHGGLR